jgi:hypothetical protein
VSLLIASAASLMLAGGLAMMKCRGPITLARGMAILSAIVVWFREFFRTADMIRKAKLVCPIVVGHFFKKYSSIT